MPSLKYVLQIVSGKFYEGNQGIHGISYKFHEGKQGRKCCRCHCVKERFRSSPNPCSGRLSTITTGDLRNGAVGDFWDGVFGYFGDGTVED